MRHRKRGRHLGRTSSHRVSLRRNLACNLFLHGRIQTTPAKAKEVRSFVEKLITLARVESIANFRRAMAFLDDKYVVRKLFKEIAPRYRERPGGYTRILRLDESGNRLGDNAGQVIFELVSESEAVAEAKPEGKKKGVRERLRRLAGGKETPEGAPAGEAKAEAPAEAESKPATSPEEKKQSGQ